MSRASVILDKPVSYCYPNSDHSKFDQDSDLRTSDKQNVN